MEVQVVWFKRDLRWHDHAALNQAASQGVVRCVYVHEPQLWQQPDAAPQHWAFILQSLQALSSGLQQLGVPLEVYSGGMIEVLDRLWQQAPFTALHSHQETGNGFTFERDRAVGLWCRMHGVRWQQQCQFGVVRALKDRRHWQAAWEQHMTAPSVAPAQIRAWQPHARPWPEWSVPLAVDTTERQRGGRLQGLEVLHSFLELRCVGYRGGISSPLIAPKACSRISPYLAYGCLSLREVVQATREALAKLPPNAHQKRKGLGDFLSRLHWHCHFIQKLESEPAIEWHNMHRGYDGLREHEFNEDHFTALKQARTGWPMVDACVVMLRQTGWLNFRMRAMLVSVAAYPLWLHWRPVGEWLATQFLDYEPGIHWSQLQMQSGTTGINTTRVYNPVKQAMDHDPEGRFVRHWLPYMRRVPAPWLFEPWRMPSATLAQMGLVLGRDVPVPLVDLKIATQTAKARLHERRRQEAVQAGNPAVISKHASRKQPLLRSKRAVSASDQAQLSLDI